MLIKKYRHGAKGLLLTAIFGVAAAGAWAQPIEAVLPTMPKGEIAKLIAGKRLFDDVKAGAAGLRFAPAGVDGDSLRALASTPDSKLVVQSVFLLKGNGFAQADRLTLFNELSKIQSLSGVTYYSESRGEKIVLFDDVFRVAAPGSHNPLPDPQFAAIPDKFKMVVHIKDANFGSTWYSLAIESNPSAISVCLENAKPLGVFVFHAFAAGGVKMRFVVTQVDEGLLVSGVCVANPSAAAAALVDMFSAIQKRVQAVEGWVLKRVEANSNDTAYKGG